MPFTSPNRRQSCVWERVSNRQSPQVPAIPNPRQSAGGVLWAVSTLFPLGDLLYNTYIVHIERFRAGLVVGKATGPGRPHHHHRDFGPRGGSAPYVYLVGGIIRRESLL